VTVTDTVVISYLGISSSIAASAIEAAAKRREAKYIEICRSHHFFPIVIEPFGPINEVCSAFISTLGYRISLVTDDPCETCFLFQRLSVAVQHFNAVGIDLFCKQFVVQPRRILICLFLMTLEMKYQG
jgi:hypothetical protein